MSNKYYTKNGDLIKNPEAYSKTGAPMYTTKFEDSANINEETYIYKLNLENGKKYIGKTKNFDKRMNEHFTGNGSKVTQKFKPLDGEVIDVTYGYKSNDIEHQYTEEYIKKYGYENVRGGYYTNSHTLKKNKNNNCYRCGRSGHMSFNCYASTHKDGYYL
jgi:predicted GIY-YIG superfamily endonuclease